MILLIAALACAPPRDPMAELRATYVAANQADPRSMPAQAQVRVGDEAMGRLARELLDQPLTAPGPFGMRLVIVPDVQRASVRVDGDGPLRLRGDLAGQADLAFPLMSADDLAWEASLDGMVLVDVQRGPDGTVLGLTWQNADHVDVRATLPGATDAIGAVVEGMVRGAVQSSMSDPVSLRLPETPWANVRDARLRGVDGDLVADLVVSGAGGAPPPPLPPTGDGWAASASEGTLLGVVRALALQQDWDSKLVVEPLALSIDGGRATVDLRVHERSVRPKYRDYRVETPVTIGESGLLAPVDELELLGHERWRGGLRVRLGEQRALRLLRDGLAGVPLRVIAPLHGTRQLALDVRSVELDEGALILRGGAEVVVAPAAPAP